MTAHVHTDACYDTRYDGPTRRLTCLRPPQPRPQPDRPPQWVLDEARRQGTPDPVAPYDRMDLRVDPPQPRPRLLPQPVEVRDRPRFPWLTWILVIVLIVAVAYLIANRPAPRTSHQPTVELSPGRGTTAGAGDTSPTDLGASAGGSFGAPHERWAVVESGPIRHGGAP